MINILTNEIKKKKEFQSVDNSFIQSLVKDDYKNIEDKLLNHSHPQKTKDFKRIVKKTRKTLHDVYGVFNINTKNRVAILDKIKKNPKNKELHISLLETHRSSKERLDSYGEIYDKILDRGDQKILDIGCGLNPVSWIFMKHKPKEYTALELTRDDCDFLNNYFRAVNLNGKAIPTNLLKEIKFQKADVCFMFKVLDSLEEVKKNISKDLLKRINCKKIVVSFPLRTISGKERISKRKWFERLLTNFEKFEIRNEIFYIIHKENIY